MTVLLSNARGPDKDAAKTEQYLSAPTQMLPNGCSTFDGGVVA
jgi:hypothetical protein